MHWENHGGPPLTREHQFHPVRRWLFDYALPDAKIAIEIEGGVWVKGRHNTGVGFIKDCEKYNQAAMLGWLVIRLPTGVADDGEKVRAVVEWVKGRIGR